jgi:hypothetical protein
MAGMNCYLFFAAPYPSTVATVDFLLVCRPVSTSIGEILFTMPQVIAALLGVDFFLVCRPVSTSIGEILFTMPQVIAALLGADVLAILCTPLPLLLIVLVPIRPLPSNRPGIASLLVGAVIPRRVLTA